MSNTATNAEAVARPNKATMFRRLVQAALLGAVLIPLGSVAVETASVSCRFNNTGEGSYGGSYCNAQEGEDFFSATQDTSRFDFGAYYLELQFLLDPTGADFTVQVNTSEVDPDQMGEFSEDYECIALTQGGPCVNFEVIPSVPREGNWLSYEIEIHWDKWAGQEYDPALMRILHDFGADSDDVYDEDMCATALNDSSYLACEIDPDPGIRSGNTDFQNFTAALASTPLTVPEPSSLALLAIGTGSVALRRRRRSSR